METLEDKQREWILGSFQSSHRLRCYSGRQWQERCTQLHRLPTHIAQNAPSSSPSPYYSIIFSLYCITTGPHSSITLSPFIPCRDLFQIPPSPGCLSILPSSSLLLTQSSDCIALHLHSSGGSSSCKYACPGSCCGCCALYSHWAPCQTGKVVRIR